MRNAILRNDLKFLVNSGYNQRARLFAVKSLTSVSNPYLTLQSVNAIAEQDMKLKY